MLGFCQENCIFENVTLQNFCGDRPFLETPNTPKVEVSEPPGCWWYSVCFLQPSLVMCPVTQQVESDDTLRLGR